MLTLLSPAKTLDYETPSQTKTATMPKLLDQSALLVDELREFTSADLSALMGISGRLGTLNRNRFANWETPFTKGSAKQAVLAFMGDVYEGLEAASFSADDFKFAQKHLRILSGLYGVLRPLDLMLPYRLEMGTKLKTERGNNLYEFWGDGITEELNKQLRTIKSTTVINLASIEYFKSVNVNALNAEVLAPTFLDRRGDTYKIISFYAKKMRGRMASWIIRNQVDDIKQLRKFKFEGYKFSSDLSTPEKPAFIRDKRE